MKKRLIDFALVTAGAFIAAVGFNCFFLENHIASGGVVGLAVSLKALFGWNPGNFVMITNVPLLLAFVGFSLEKKLSSKPFMGHGFILFLSN